MTMDMLDLQVKFEDSSEGLTPDEQRIYFQYLIDSNELSWLDEAYAFHAARLMDAGLVHPKMLH